jgi:hypothetical protein
VVGVVLTGAALRDTPAPLLKLALIVVMAPLWPAVVRLGRTPRDLDQLEVAPELPAEPIGRTVSRASVLVAAFVALFALFAALPGANGWVIPAMMAFGFGVDFAVRARRFRRWERTEGRRLVYAAGWAPWGAGDAWYAELAPVGHA